MSKLHYCINGRTVTEQVCVYLNTKNSDDFLPILLYYEKFKNKWFEEVQDHIDRHSFESDFEFKLLNAVNSFDFKKALEHSNKHNLSEAACFNRWFYRILLNWRSNVKNCKYTMKKKPSVSCPVCGRRTTRIDVEHLQHIKSVVDLPKYVVWDNEIYHFFHTPKTHTISWGHFNKNKYECLLKDETKEYASDKKRVKWPWKLENGRRGVLCPFTNKIVEKINDEYIRSLPDKHKRYAEPLTWSDFVQKYPYAATEAPLYSIEHEKKDGLSFSDIIVDKNNYDNFSIDMLEQGITPSKYEVVFKTIDSMVLPKVDSNVLKLLAAGYDLEEISSVLAVDLKIIKNKIKQLGNNALLKNKLVGTKGN